jgi:hypothetical protein
MPDQELLDDFLEALETAGSPAINPELHQPQRIQRNIKLFAGAAGQGQVVMLDVVVQVLEHPTVPALGLCAGGMGAVKGLPTVITHPSELQRAQHLEEEAA